MIVFFASLLSLSILYFFSPLLSLSFLFRNLLARASNALYAPDTYECIPVVSNPKVGIFVSYSIIFAIALKSVPIIVGIGVPAMAIKFGLSSFAV